MYLYCYRNGNGVSQKFDKYNLNPFGPNGIMVYYDINFHATFQCLKEMKTFWGTTKKCENKNNVISYFNQLFYDALDRTG